MGSLESPVAPTPRAAGRGPDWRHVLLLGPLACYLAVFYLYPLSGVLAQSVFDPGPTAEHYLALVTYPVYGTILLNTLEISFKVALFCVLLGYPVAYVLSGSRSRWGLVLLTAVILPLWISVLVRTYAWMIILGRFGVVNELLRQMGLTDQPLRLMYNRTGVYVGLAYVLLPYAILPMLSVMRGIDRTLLRASGSLGSSPWHAFVRVFLPLSLPGVGAGFLLPFIISVGIFITPTLMGGPSDTMIALSIHTQLGVVNDWGLASSLSTMLLVVVLLIFAASARVFGFATVLGLSDGSLPGMGATRRPVSGRGPLAWAGRLRRGILTQGRRDALSDAVNGLMRRMEGLRRATARTMPGWWPAVDWNRWAVTALCAAVFTAMVLPLFVVLPLAFSNQTHMHFPPQSYGLGLFGSYLTSAKWLRATANSFCVAVPVTMLATTLGTLGSFSLVRGRYRGKAMLYALFLCPLIIPGIISAVSSYFFLAKLKLIGTITGLVLAHTVLAVPYVVIVMTSTLDNCDRQLEQASMTLGAGRLRTFCKVTLPAIRPGLMTAMLFSFIASFDELLTALFVSGARATTLPKQMWHGIRDEMDPVVAAVAAMLILLTLTLMGLLLLAKRRR